MDFLLGDFVAIARDVGIIFEIAEADIKRVPKGMVVDDVRVAWLGGR